MTENTNNSTTDPVWKRRWFRVLSIIIIVIALTLTALPLVIGKAMKSWLLENGADNVDILNIDFNPFTGTAAVNGLDVRIADQAVISNSLVYVDVSLAALFKKGFALENARMEKLQIDIEQSADGKLRIGSLVIDPGKKPDKEIKEEIKEEISWWLGLGTVTLNECTIKYRSPKLTTTIYIDELLIKDLSTKPGEQSANLKITARLNNADIKTDIKLHQLSPGVKADGDLSIQNINLQEFSGLTTETLDTLTGMINLSGNLAFTTSPDSNLDIQYAGKTVVSAGEVSSKDFAVAGSELEWDGVISFLMQSGGSHQTIKLDGRLGGSELIVALPETLDAKSSTIGWQGTVDLDNQSSSGAIAVKLDGSLEGNGYAIKLPGIETSGAGAAWKGQVEYAKEVSAAPQEISIAGNLNGKELTLNLAEQNMLIQQTEITLTPQLALQISADTTGLTGTAAINATGMSISDTARALTLLAIDKLNVDGIKLESLNQASISGITIAETKLIQGQESEQPSVSIGNTNISNFNFNADKGLSIEKIALANLAGTFVREKDGSMDITNALRAQETTGNEAKQPAQQDSKQAPPSEEKPAKLAEPESSVAINIAEFTVKDDSMLRFKDYAVSPAFESVLDIASLQITNIDSSKPDQPIAVNLDGKLNNYASLTVKGAVKPFAEQPGLDLKIDLENQNMVALSPYLISSTGYMIHAGQLQLDSKVVIDKGSIDAKNTIYMKKLHLEEADATVIKENAGSIGMPLDKALGMLRDKNDNIKLEVPILGKLDEIEIGKSQIINTVLKKATTAGMKTYLLYAFQPYGALIMVGQAVGKQVGKINLDPVQFEPGEDKLTSAHKDYLKKLGKVMQDRPKIDVQICAYTTIADLSLRKEDAKEKAPGELSQRQIDKAVKLGHVRQKIIKDYLISEFKVDDGRLILCAPEYDNSKDAKPRVELLI